MTLASIIRHLHEQPASLDLQTGIITGISIDGADEWKIMSAGVPIRLILADGFGLSVGSLRNLRYGACMPLVDLHCRRDTQVFDAFAEVARLAQEATR